MSEFSSVSAPRHTIDSLLAESAPVDSDEESIPIRKAELIYEPEYKRRQWMIKHGKGHMLDF
jgi:hypothetical protein